MKINENNYKKFKKKIEAQLRKYPFYMISIEAPGLGSASFGEKSSSGFIDPTGDTAVNDEYKRQVVNAVQSVYEHNLDSTSKRIIECAYFLDNTITREEVQAEKNISERQYWTMKKNALYKFGIALGFYI